MTYQLTRHPDNPVLHPDRVPGDATQAFNAGITRWHGRYVMVYRADTWSREQRREVGTFIGKATSDDGVHWQTDGRSVFSWQDDEVRRAYDPRLTVLDGRLYMCFALDTRHGIRGGVAVTDDPELGAWEVLSLSGPDNRNMVIFPERIRGRIARLERPFPIYGRRAPEAFDLWYADSPDGRDWGNIHLVLGSDQVPYCNNKIGPAAPPILTDRGWLALFHAVVKDDAHELKSWHGGWHKRYHAGLMLLDRDEPWKLLGISPEPVLDPRDEYDYEMDGFRGSVIFPGGMLLDDDGRTVRVYYGASDTYVALATGNLDDMLDTIKPL